MIVIDRTLTIMFTLGLIILVLVTSCQQSDKNNLSNNQKQILTEYASKYLLNKNQYLYHRSVDSIEALSPPLSKDDFRAFDNDWPNIDSSKVNDISRFTKSLPFSKKELEDWSNQISKYEQHRWYPESFPQEVNFIREEEIPDYLSRTDIPPPGQDPMDIHYISIPFVYNAESALLYSSTWGKVSYHYFVKKNNSWKEVQTGPITFY